MENSEPVRLARYAIEERVTNGRVLSIPEWVSRELRTMMAGCFVSIHKRRSPERLYRHALARNGEPGERDNTKRRIFGDP